MYETQNQEEIDELDIFNSENSNQENLFLEKSNEELEKPVSHQQIKHQDFDSLLLEKLIDDNPLFANWWGYINNKLGEKARQDWLNILESQDIVGHEEKETLFILNHCMPFAVKEVKSLLENAINGVSKDFQSMIYEKIALLGNHLDIVDARHNATIESVQTLIEVAEHVVAHCEQQIDTMINSSQAELEAATLMRITQIEVAREKVIAEVDATINGEIKIIREKIAHEMSQLRTAVFKTTKDEMHKAATDAFNTAHKRISTSEFIKMGCVCFGGTLIALFVGLKMFL